MPCINRIRIINFTYNNDVRHILDETFRFHDGEHALLNLANGGGKSVLVQLMLQPIIPRAKIQNRPISNFFKKQKRPAYVLIEWKLEGKGGYLMTGIGMASEESYSAEDDEQGRIRHFCFLTKYHQAHSYAHSLSNIDLVNHEDGIVHVRPYKESQDMLREASRKDPHAVSYFSVSDKDLHRRKLLEFGISQDEWENVMRPVNNSEGGLEEIFSKSRTSDQLLNTWLIPTVEKALSSGTEQASGVAGAGKGRRTGTHALQQLFEDLLKETMDHESNVMTRQQLQGFQPEFRQLKDRAEQLAAGIHELRGFETKLSAAFEWLADEKESCAEKLQRVEDDKQHLQAEMQHIRQEDISEKVHAARAVWKQAHEKLQDGRDIEAAAIASEEETLRAFQCMKASRHHLVMQKEQAAITMIEQEKDNLSRQDDRADTMNGLRSSLWQAWTAKLQEALNEVASLHVQRTETEQTRNRLREVIKSYVQEREESTQLLIRLTRELSAFEESEKSTAKLLGMQWSRNLAGELIDSEAKGISAKLAGRLKEAENQHQKLTQEEATCKEHLLTLHQEEVDHTKEMRIQEDEVRDINLCLEEWKSYTAQRSIALQRNGLTADMMREEAIAALFLKQQALQARVFDTNRQSHEIEARLLDLKEGRYHGSGDFLNLLREAGIDNQTGEMYLRQQTDAARLRLLSAMPFLPHALIVSAASFEALPETIKQEASVGTAIFLTYDWINDWLADVERTDLVTLQNQSGAGKLLLGSSIEEMALDVNQVPILLEQTTQRRKQLDESLENLQAALHTLLQDIQLIEKNTYGPGWEKSMRAKLEKARLLHEKLSEKLAECKEKQAASNARRDELLRSALPQADSVLKGIQTQQMAWQELLSRNAAYVASYKRIGDAKQRIKTLEDLQIKADEQLEQLSEALYRLERMCSEVDQLARDARAKQYLYDAWKTIAVAGSEAHAAIETSVQLETLAPLESSEVLEAKLVELERSFGWDMQQLELRLSDCRNAFNSAEKEYQKIAGKIGETFELPAYSNAAEERLEKEHESSQKSRIQAGRMLEPLIEQGTAAKVNLSHTEGELTKVGLAEPLPLEEIRGQYASRMASVQNEFKRLEFEMGSLNKQMNLMDNERQRILDTRIHLQPGGKVTWGTPENWKPELDGLHKNYQTEQKALSAGREAFGSIFYNLRNNHSGSEIVSLLFRTLEPILERLSQDDDAHYYLYERMQEQADILEKKLELLDTVLQGLERSRLDVIEQCFMHGRRIADELKRLEEHSSVRLEGRATTVNMLKVDIAAVNEPDARQRITRHVDTSISGIRAEMRAGREVKTPANIASATSSRELLNTYLGTPNLPVRVYKIDLNMSNSRFKVWEDAVRENSGGEKFVVYFSVLTALMAYSRATEQARLLASGVESASDEHRVLIMDNPFGPISSQHLLKPLFDIANKYKTQLICLTDLKQSSILNNFNLVYMLRIRKSATSSDEYVKLEEYRRDGASGEGELVEKAFYHASDFKQMKLFE